MKKLALLLPLPIITILYFTGLINMEQANLLFSLISVIYSLVFGVEAGRKLKQKKHG
ncbi:MAG: hypothetical protein QXF97_06505 [Candidatus Caldarchaeum sp.]